MKKHVLHFCLTAIATLLLLASPASAAATFSWNVASPGANNWNVNANWLPATGNPGSTDTALFGATGTGANSSTIDSVVSVPTAITALNYTNNATGTWHVTQIPAAVTLTTSGNVIVGGGFGDGFVASAAMTGGGTFQANGNAFIIGEQGSTTLNSGTILDLSGLSNFVFNASAGAIQMGVSNRSTANLTLAAVSNSITAATINVDTGSTSSSGTAGNLKFGAGTNNINVGAINIAAGRTAGSATFATSTGGLRLRGTAGGDADRVTTVVLGNRNTGSSTAGSTTGTINFNSHPVDAKIGTLTLGQNSQTANTNLSGIGNFSFDQGTVDITTVNMGVCGGNSATLSLTNGAIGTLTVGASGTLLLNSVSLGNVTSTAQGSFANGTLFINGGTAVCTNNIVKTTALTTTGTVAVASSGTLFAQGKIGTPAIPIDNLNVTNATLRLKVDASGAITTNVVATAVNAGGTTTIDIAQVAGVTGPTTFPLIAYSTLNGTVAGNFYVTLPGGYFGSLVDNSAQKRIDLSISPNVIIVPLVWTGATNGDWDLATSNWTSAGALATYTDASATVFDDSASNSTVNLTAPLAPLNMTMSNSVLNYIFTGTGSLVNTNILTLKGSATTILDNTGSNSFTGGISISAGTLQVGNNDANGNLPDGQAVIDNASLAFNRTDNPTNNSIISGTGALLQNGSGTLTLVGANSYGATTISVGALQIGAGGTSGSLGSGVVTDNGSLTFNRSDNVTVANVINGSGSVTKINNNVLTLSASSGFGGGLTANAGTVRLANTNAAGTGTIVVNPDAIVVLATNNINNNITLAGGTLAAAATQNPLKLELTAAASTTSTLLLADPVNIGAVDPFEVAFTNSGVWHGSGTVIVATVTNDPTPDSGNGFRLRGLAASDFSGTIVLSNSVKGELQTTVAGPFSPAGTGKIVVCAGVLTNNTVNGTFAELNLRNISSSNTTLGNNVEIFGTGIAVLDPLGAAPDGSSVTMGNLKVGGGQELGVNVNGTAGTGFHTVVFNTVTLNGGNATFSPKTSGWNTTPQVGSDLTLGNITELVADSGFTMTGLRTLTLAGNSANAYTGPTTNANGTLALSKTSGYAIPGTFVITGGTVAYAGNDQIADGAAISVAGGTLALGAFNDTVGAVSLISGSITGSGGTLTGASYDAQAGSVSANLGGAATLTKSTTGTVVLSGTNSYTGSTLINAGILQLTGNGSIYNSSIIAMATNAMLDVSGRADSTLTVNSNQTFIAGGTLNGSLVAAAGSQFELGQTNGSDDRSLFITGNATFAGAMTITDLDHGSNCCSPIVLSGTLTYGGTLTVKTNLASAPLTSGTVFKLFSAASYSGNFTSTNLPALAAGLAWIWNPTNGTLAVVASVNPTPTNIIASVSGGVLTLAWPADHIGWRLQVQTNSLAGGIFTNWVDVAASATTNQINIPLDPANDAVFYRMVY